MFCKQFIAKRRQDLRRDKTNAYILPYLQQGKAAKDCYICNND